MQTRLRITAGGLALVGFLLLGGCAVVPPQTPVERDFGLSTRLAIYGQTLNPAAEESLEPVTGQAGAAAIGAYNKYQASFGAQTGGPAYTVPAGTGVTIQIQEKKVPSEGLGKLEK